MGFQLNPVANCGQDKACCLSPHLREGIFPLPLPFVSSVFPRTIQGKPLCRKEHVFKRGFCISDAALAKVM